jgi:uncharacterized membrane protein
MLLVAVAAIGAIAISLATLGIGPRSTSVTGVGSINIDARDIQQGRVKFFSYRDDAGARIRFLLARDGNGEIRGAIDACQRCYTFHKGYTASNGYLICRLCGNRYKVDEKNLGVASCTPVKLPLASSGTTVQVKTIDLERARTFF